MNWLVVAAVLLVVVLVLDWRRPLPRAVRIALGAIIIAGGFVRLAYVEWHYLSGATKPFDIALPLDRATTLQLPSFRIARAGAYDIWLQTDRPSALLAEGCVDPDYHGEKPCPEHLRTLDLDWTALRDGHWIASDATAMPPFTASAPRPGGPVRYSPGAFEQQPNGSASSASDQTPEYRYLGTFTAPAPGSYALAVDLHAPNPRLAARHPRLIVGLSSVETAPTGLSATLFCVLCVFGGGFMLLKALVPRNAPA